jgi:hypothetical protein
MGNRERYSPHNETMNTETESRPGEAENILRITQLFLQRDYIITIRVFGTGLYWVYIGNDKERHDVTAETLHECFWRLEKKAGLGISGKETKQ